MYWLSRPPYLRWAAACLLIGFALYSELAPPPTVPHPFAAGAIRGGAEVTEADVVFHPVPIGLFPPVSLPFVTGRAIAEGAPVLASDADDRPRAPAGWWAIEMPVPAETAVAADVRIVVGEDVVAGIVVAPPRGDGFSEPVALVAVPGESAAEVAVAASENRAIVMVTGG